MGADSSDLVEDLVRAGRIEVTWSRSVVKWIRLRDPVTGVEVEGRSTTSWRHALTQAEHRLVEVLRDSPI